jgi:uncharacterized protein (TIGR02444 family)
MADGPTKHFDALWQFTLAAYKREGVPAACLALQDEYGLDVNVLFLCLFAGARGHELPTHEFALIDDIVAPWKESVIHPLRSVRRHLKARIPSSPELLESLYREVLASEIKAEEHEHYLIATTLRIPAGVADATVAAVNLVRYLRVSGAPVNHDSITILANLMSGVMAGTATIEAQRLLEQSSLSPPPRETGKEAT